MSVVIPKQIHSFCHQ